MALDHKQARQDATEGFYRKFLRMPLLPEVQLLQAVGALETGYGTGWKGEGVDSNNMGAITAGAQWSGGFFIYHDTYPDEQGINHSYTTKFRAYRTRVEGWIDLVDIMYQDRPSVLAAASAGDSYGVSSALYQTKYFLGFGKNAQERIANHHAALQRNLIAQCRALGEPLPNGDRAPNRTLKRGCAGDDVKELQRILGLVADGRFGPVTEEVVRAFQSDHGLKSDGIVGPLTWAELSKEVDNAQSEPVDSSVTICENLRNAAIKLREELDNYIDLTGVDLKD